MRKICHSDSCNLKESWTFTYCFITDETSFFSDISDFEVIMFNVGRVYTDMEIPNKRSEKQKYVLVAVEPAAMNTIPSNFNMYINITWTYKLNSDITLPYIAVKYDRGDVVGPNIDMHVMDVENMNDTSLFIRNA